MACRDVCYDVLAGAVLSVDERSAFRYLRYNISLLYLWDFSVFLIV